MRMRKKPNLIPRLERCAGVGIESPQRFRGGWLEAFPGYGRIRVELGCGKGRFTAGLAQSEPDTLFLAVERVPEAIVVAMERVCALGLDNVRFILGDVRTLPEIFQPGEADRIYINFCDPWPKSRYEKNRLTAPAFLKSYAKALTPGGMLFFKTDNPPLFEYSLRQLEDGGWDLIEVTYDLHANGPAGIMTDYEAKFHERGVKINRCTAVRTEITECG